MLVFRSVYTNFFWGGGSRIWKIQVDVLLGAYRYPQMKQQLLDSNRIPRKGHTYGKLKQPKTPALI